MNKLTVLKVVPDKIVEIWLNGSQIGVLIPGQELSLPATGELKLVVGSLQATLDSILLPLDCETWLSLSSDSEKKLTVLNPRDLGKEKLQIILRRESVKEKLMHRKYKALYESTLEELKSAKLLKPSTEEKIKETEPMHILNIESGEIDDKHSHILELENAIFKLNQSLQHKNSEIEILKNQNSLLKSQYENDIKLMRSQYFTLETKLKASENQKSSLSLLLNQLSDKWDKASNQTALFKVGNLENQNKDLNSQVSFLKSLINHKEAISCNSYNLNSETESKNLKLKKKINQLRNEIDTLKKASTCEDYSFALVKQLLAKYKLESSVIARKIKENVFMLNDKRIVLDLKSGGLSCKYKNKTYQLEEFVRSNFYEEKEILTSREHLCKTPNRRRTSTHTRLTTHR